MSTTTATKKNDVELRDYTKEEIDKLSLKELEQLARRLEWRARYSGYYGGTSNRLDKYRHSGFPNTYQQKTMHSREEFLRTRIKSSKKLMLAKTNQDKKEKAKKDKEAEKKRLASLPKVQWTVDPILELRENKKYEQAAKFKITPKNHVITIERIREPKDYLNSSVLFYNATELPKSAFKDAVALLKETPTVGSKTVGKVRRRVTSTVLLSHGSNNYSFEKSGDENVTLTRVGHSDDLKFAVSDLEKLDELLNQKVEVVVKESKK